MLLPNLIDGLIDNRTRKALNRFTLFTKDCVSISVFKGLHIEEIPVTLSVSTVSTLIVSLRFQYNGFEENANNINCVRKPYL